MPWYFPRRGSSSAAKSFWADVVGSAKFMFMPKLKDSVVSALLDAHVELESVWDLPPTGSIACGARLSPVLNVWGFNPAAESLANPIPHPLMNHRFDVHSAEYLEPHLVSAATLFGYRKKRGRFAIKSISPARFDDESFPDGWIDNRDDWMQDYDPGTLKSDEFQANPVCMFIPLSEFLAGWLRK